MTISTPSAKLLGYGALIAALIVIFVRGKKAGAAPPTRRAIAATVLGSGCIILAGPAPQVSAPLAAILLADVLIRNNGATSITDALGHVIAPGLPGVKGTSAPIPPGSQEGQPPGGQGGQHPVP